MKPITIKLDKDGALEVCQGDLTTGALTLGEMLEQVLSLVPNTSGAFKHSPRYEMRTPEDWEKRSRRFWNLPTSVIEISAVDAGPVPDGAVIIGIDPAAPEDGQ